MVSMRRVAILLAVTSSVSAQSCYYAAGKLASSNYIPCGSTANGQQQSCCHLGDQCLDGGICFDYAAGMSYIAGCTDSSYKDGTCGAQQCSKNTQIQGVARPCSNSPNNWQCCTGSGQQASDPSKTSPDSCPCDSNAGVVLTNNPSPAWTATLPTNTNGQIALISNGQTVSLIPVPSPSPTSSSISSSSSSSSSTSSATSSSTSSSASSATTSPSGAAQTSPSTSDSQPSSSSSASPNNSGSSSGGGGLPTSSKIIIGVVVPLVIIVLAVIGFIGYRFYRRRQDPDGEFGGGRGWDPFRHQPASRGSRSSAVWDSAYTAPAMSNYGNGGGYHTGGTGGGYTQVHGEDVAEAVRRNAEQHRQHTRTVSDTGGHRPMSEMGGLVNWRNS